MQRRKFLSILGGGVVVAATGAAVFAMTRTPAAALAPWGLAGGPRYTDPRLRALSFAILAPNPHNRQPWLVELVGEDGVILRVDRTRLLPHTDPFNRQIVIGLGCFLELMVMAAAADGHRVALDVFPQGGDARALGDEIVASANFTKDEAVVADPLFAHVFERRSNKEPFDTIRPVETSALQAVIAAGAHGTALGGANADADVAFWRELTARALKIEIDTPHTYKESVDLFRIGKAEINANPDGIDFSGPLLESLALVGQFDRNVALDRNSTAFIQGEAAVLENALTATAHVWMVTAGNTRADQIAAGRDWLRVNLAATREGLGFQPLSQALQEYPEVAEPYRQTHERLAPSGGTVQMLVRLGYGPRVDQSPRWPLESRLI